MPLTPLPIRLFCDLASPSNLNDLNRNSQPPSFYRGDDIEIDIGLGENGALLTSLSNVASVTAQIFAAENDTNPPMVSGTTSTINTALTQTEWANNTAPFYHAAFVFPNSQTAISLGGASSVNYWLRLTAQTSDSPSKNITLLDGPITVKDGPVSTFAVPSGAAYQSNAVGGQIVLQLLDSTTGLYHTLSLLNEGAGVLTLQLSDAGYAQVASPPAVVVGAAFRGYIVNGQAVLQLLDNTTGLYHTLAILDEGGGVLTLQLSDQGY